LPAGRRFALVASRFNHFIVDRLVEGALDALVRHGADPKNVTLVRVPGAWEIPRGRRARVGEEGASTRSSRSAAVIRGATPHFDYVAGEVRKGSPRLRSQTGVPVAFGVLTTDTIEQAIERAGTKAGNKGWDAAVSAIEMVSLARDDSALHGRARILRPLIGAWAHALRARGRAPDALPDGGVGRDRRRRDRALLAELRGGARGRAYADEACAASRPSARRSTRDLAASRTGASSG
jgi:6,7-dimethyl-8-ribityllumazine synthase